MITIHHNIYICICIIIIIAFNPIQFLNNNFQSM